MADERASPRGSSFSLRSNTSTDSFIRGAVLEPTWSRPGCCNFRHVIFHSANDLGIKFCPRQDALHWMHLIAAAMKNLQTRLNSRCRLSASADRQMAQFRSGSELDPKVAFYILTPSSIRRIFFAVPWKAWALLASRRKVCDSSQSVHLHVIHSCSTPPNLFSHQGRSGGAVRVGRRSQSTVQIV